MKVFEQLAAQFTTEELKLAGVISALLKENPKLLEGEKREEGDG